MAEGIHQRFAQRRQRNRELLFALQPIPGNARRCGEVALAEQDRLLQQLEGMAVQLALIQELPLVGAAEAGQPQLALGQHRPACTPTRNVRSSSSWSRSAAVMPTAF